MEINNLFTIICFSIPILVILGIIFLVILFLIIRGLLRKARRKAGIPKDAGKIIREQLANFDQYVQNDQRQMQAWQSSAPLKEEILDLEDIEDSQDSSAQPEKARVIPLPNWVSDSLTCASCGAPQQLNDRVCPFCGHKH